MLGSKAAAGYDECQERVTLAGDSFGRTFEAQTMVAVESKKTS